MPTTNNSVPTEYTCDLAAINPNNTELLTDEVYMCHSQGDLIYLIQKGNFKNIFLDPDLPGLLSANALISYLKSNYPDIEISIVKPLTPILPTRPETDLAYCISEAKPKNPAPAILLVAVIQLLINFILQFNSLTPRFIILFSAAALFSIAISIGGLRWVNRIKE